MDRASPGPFGGTLSRADAHAGGRPFKGLSVGRFELVLPSKSNEARTAIDRIFDAHGFSREPCLELDTFDAVILALSQAGSNLASILPHHSIETSSEARCLRRGKIGDPPIHRTIGLPTRSSRRCCRRSPQKGQRRPV